MDRLSIMSGALFFAANVFAVTSLALPDWIVTEVRNSLILRPALADHAEGVTDQRKTYKSEE